MRAGWDLKSAAHVLDVHPKKVPQAIGPAFIKVARLMLADPRKTMIELNEAMSRVRELDQMPDDELSARVSRLEGRANK